MTFCSSGMGHDEGRLNKAPRPVPDFTSIRQGYISADANLRRQRESKVASPRRWFDSTRSNPRLSGFAIPRSTRYHRRKVRFQC